MPERTPEEKQRILELRVKLLKQVEPFLPKPDKKLVGSMVQKELITEVKPFETNLRINVFTGYWLKELCRVYENSSRSLVVKELLKDWKPGDPEPGKKEIKEQFRKMRSDHENALEFIRKTHETHRFEQGSVIRPPLPLKSTKFIKDIHVQDSFRGPTKRERLVLVNPYFMEQHMFTVNKKKKVVPLFKWKRV